MRDVLASATNVIDIWPYVAAIPATDLQGHQLARQCVERVYRDATSSFDHVLVVTKTPSVFLVVVVDLVRDTVLGHRVLDLKQEYGLASSG